MSASIVALRKGVFACALSAGFGLLGIPSAGAVTWDLSTATGNLGPTQMYTVDGLTVTATAGTFSASTGAFTPSTSASGPQLFGKAVGGDENGLGVTPGVDNEISGNSVIEIAFPSAASSRTFSMESATAPDNWTVYDSSNATSGFSPVAGLENQTNEGVDHNLPDAAFYIFAIGNEASSSVLLGTLDATTVPLPPAIVLFGAALAGLGFLGRRRKEGSALQAF